MHFIDDEYFIGSLLRLKPYLIRQISNVFDRIIGSRVQFNDIEGLLFGKRFTGSTGPASFPIGSAVKAVDGPGQDPGARSLADTAGPAK